ncbi:MAG: hypothetical protein V3G42_12245 [Oscillospiraceae bacterium]
MKIWQKGDRITYATEKKFDLSNFICLVGYLLFADIVFDESGAGSGTTTTGLFGARVMHSTSGTWAICHSHLHRRIPTSEN